MSKISIFPPLDAIKLRFSLFFRFSDNRLAYKIVKVIFIAIFTIPFSIINAIEFIFNTFMNIISLLVAIILTVLFLGKISLVLCYILGIIVGCINKIFYCLFCLFVLPEIIFDDYNTTLKRFEKAGNKIDNDIKIEYNKKEVNNLNL